MRSFIALALVATTLAAPHANADSKLEIEARYRPYHPHPNGGTGTAVGTTSTKTTSTKTRTGTGSPGTGTAASVSIMPYHAAIPTSLGINYKLAPQVKRDPEDVLPIARAVPYQPAAYGTGTGHTTTRPVPTGAISSGVLPLPSGGHLPSGGFLTLTSGAPKPTGMPPVPENPEEYPAWWVTWQKWAEEWIKGPQKN